MVRCVTTLTDSTQFLKLFKELILKLAALVTHDAVWEFMTQYEIVEEPISSSCPRLVSSCVTRRKMSEMINNDYNVLISTSR